MRQKRDAALAVVEQAPAPAVLTESRPAPMSFREAMRPRNFPEALRMCEMLGQSSVVPAGFKNDPMAIMVVIEAGERHGMGVLEALQSHCMINGVPRMFGDARLAIVRRSGLLESIEEWSSGSRSAGDYVAYCTVKRQGSAPRTASFPQSMAKDACLGNKGGPWRAYFSRMMMFKARSWVLRDEFGDVLAGISQADAEEYVELDPKAEREMLARMRLQGIAEDAPVVVDAAPAPVAEDGVVASQAQGHALPLSVDEYGALERRIAAARDVDELTVIRDENKHIAATRQVDVVAWKAIRDAYVARLGELRGGTQKGAAGLEARLDAQVPAHDARTGEVEPPPFGDDEMPGWA